LYQLNNQEQWDTDFFHTLMSEKRIISSKEAKEIRQRLSDAGALPVLDNNFDWAMLCIGYCFAKKLTENPEKLIPAPSSSGGTEIPSFQTCFQDYARLWLVLLSETLFKLNPEKKVTKDDLYTLIHKLWHTGAIELEKRWLANKACQETDLEARKAFLNELVGLAVKNAGIGNDSTHLDDVQDKNSNLNGIDLKNTPAATRETGEKIVAALQSIGKGIKSITFLGKGVRYDSYLVQFTEYVDWDKLHDKFCSAMGIKADGSEIRAEQHSGLPHAWQIKLLRPENTWQQFAQNEFQSALSQYQYSNKAFKLPVLIGVDETGNPVFADLTAAVHSFVAGKTGSGKSVFVHSLLHSLLKLNPPEQVQVAILDPKKTEYQDFMQTYSNIYGGSIVTDSNEMDSVLRELVDEVERRNDLLQAQGKKNIAELPTGQVSPRYVVVVVDEVANLLSKNKEVEDLLCQLAEKARSAGIFLLLSTQTPNSESFSQRLRANIPTRISFSVVNAKASEIVLGESGLRAEKLAGSGDHLVKWNDGKIQFLHGYNV
jgi:hypothetical protein